MKIADIHAHIFPNKIAVKASSVISAFYSVDFDTVASLDNLLQLEEEAGVSMLAVSSSATDARQVTPINDFIAQSIQGRDNVIGFGSLFPTMDGWEAELERMQAMGIRGIKIHPDFQKVDIDDPRAVDMYRGIAKAGLPVLFHTGDDRYPYSAPEKLLSLIRQVPDLIAIAAHFGGWRAWDQSSKCILPENVFYDTSSSLMFLTKERTLELLDRIGPHRFLYGTDFPMWTPKEEIARFLSLGLDETTRDRILYGNFEKLFLR